MPSSFLDGCIFVGLFFVVFDVLGIVFFCDDFFFVIFFANKNNTDKLVINYLSWHITNYFDCYFNFKNPENIFMYTKILPNVGKTKFSCLSQN